MVTGKPNKDFSFSPDELANIKRFVDKDSSVTRCCLCFSNTLYVKRAGEEHYFKSADDFWESPVAKEIAQCFAKNAKSGS